MLVADLALDFLCWGAVLLTAGLCTSHLQVMFWGGKNKEVCFVLFQNDFPRILPEGLEQLRFLQFAASEFGSQRADIIKVNHSGMSIKYRLKRLIQQVSHF